MVVIRQQGHLLRTCCMISLRKFTVLLQGVGTVDQAVPILCRFPKGMCRSTDQLPDKIGGLGRVLLPQNSGRADTWGAAMLVPDWFVKISKGP